MPCSGLGNMSGTANFSLAEAICIQLQNPEAEFWEISTRVKLTAHAWSLWMWNCQHFGPQSRGCTVLYIHVQLLHTIVKNCISAGVIWIHGYFGYLDIASSRSRWVTSAVSLTYAYIRHNSLGNSCPSGSGFSSIPLWNIIYSSSCSHISHIYIEHISP